jgi:hypothetical protein
MVSRKARDVIEPSRAFERERETNSIVWKYPETRERYESQADVEQRTVLWRQVTERVVCGDATNK